jgi:translation initiation factor 4E
LFREGIEPKWEDPRCEHGGKWTAMVSKANREQLDKMWLHGVLGSIGEQFDDGEEICGIVVNVRPKQDRISVWTKTAANEALQVCAAGLEQIRCAACSCCVVRCGTSCAWVVRA